MKKFISIILILSLISLISCTDQSAKIYSENMGSGDSVSDLESDAKTELSGTLEISTALVQDDAMGWGASIRKFQELYPDVEVIFNDTAIDVLSASFESYDIAMQKYQQDLSLKMISGGAPDLIVNMSDYTTQFVPSGLIYDLNKFIENDPEFIYEDYYMNVIEGQEINGGLYRMPTEFTFKSIRFRKDVFDNLGISEDEIDTVDYKFLYDLYFDTVESENLPDVKQILFDVFDGKALMYNEERAVAFDSNTMTVNFNAPEFIEYLETTNKYEQNSPFAFLAYEGELFSQDGYIAVGMNVAPSPSDALIDEKENVTKAYPVVTSQGELIVEAVESMTIPKDAKNPELAWEFIKFHISEGEVTFKTEDGHEYGSKGNGLIQINRNNHLNNAKSTFEYFKRDEDFTAKYFSYLESALELPVAAGLTDIQLSGALNLLQMDFYNGLMTAEECAKAMQDRAEIYFAEIE